MLSVPKYRGVELVKIEAGKGLSGKIILDGVETENCRWMEQNVQKP